MKRLILLTFAPSLLCFVAMAQTITGLPGILLSKSGTAPQFQLVNTTGNAVFAIHLREDDDFVMFWLDTAPIPADGLPHAFGQVSTHAGQSPTKISIDSIIFADGSFAGPDTDNAFTGLSYAIDECVAAGKLAQAGAWSALQSQSQGSGWSAVSQAERLRATGRKASAMSLVQIYQRKGSAEAVALASSFVALGKLHR
jgi:hypothetical protein